MTQLLTVVAAVFAVAEEEDMRIEDVLVLVLLCLLVIVVILPTLFTFDAGSLNIGDDDTKKAFVSLENRRDKRIANH